MRYATILCLVSFQIALFIHLNECWPGKLDVTGANPGFSDLFLFFFLGGDNIIVRNMRSDIPHCGRSAFPPLYHGGLSSLAWWRLWSSCVWDLLLYYFSKVPQPFHGCWAWVGQVSVRSHRWSEPGAFWQDVVRRLLRGTTQTGCWGAEAPAVHAGTETTYSSAEAVQGDPLSAREISSWWDVCAR